jgi:hypothetical protein
LAQLLITVAVLEPAYGPDAASEIAISEQSVLKGKFKGRKILERE